MASYVLMLQADADDREITEAALQEIDPMVPIRFLDSSSEIEVLIGKEGVPAIILLNDAGRNEGLSLLSVLKTHRSLNYVPVIVLGEVSNDEYIRKFYRAGANSFITKPSSVEETHKKIAAFFTYWFEVATV